MVDILGIYKVPNDWFEIAVAIDNNEDSQDYNGIKNAHRPGTQFMKQSLIEIYIDDFNRLMKACGILFTDKGNYYEFKLI